jgi:hypothetical protein
MKTVSLTKSGQQLFLRRQLADCQRTQPYC